MIRSFNEQLFLREKEVFGNNIFDQSKFVLCTKRVFIAIL